MEMKLKQSEIETALRKYVLSILTLAEGSQLAIDFAATRGPEGFTATIDIQPPTEEQPKAETVEEPIPTQTVTRKPRLQATKEPQKTVAEPEPEVATTAQTQAVEEQPSDPEPVAEEPKAEDPVDKQKPGTGFPGFSADTENSEPEIPEDPEALAVETPAADPAPEVKKPSLFANLRGS